jgi:predicted O-linked N-acetylglucosamine transferase (SPINDLY family)
MRKWLTRLLGGRREGPAASLAEATACFERGDWRGAIAGYRAVLEADAANAELWNRLGFASKEMGEMAEASRCFRRAAELAPESVGALCNAASALRDLGRVEEALPLLRKARGLAPDDLDVLSAYLFTLNFSSRVSREESFRAHLECDRLLGATPRLELEPLPREAGRLRIGYLSPDFRRHAVAFFVAPLLEHHDRDRFEVACYYLYPRHDTTTSELMGLADRWIDCAEWPPAALAEQIRSDGIDILVDLAGHTDWNGLRALAFKPARVTATWLGYLNTTGLRSVDYRITDAYADPPGETERFHTETLARLPQCQWCRQKPAGASPASALPAKRPGAVRFGSFNKAAKLGDEVLALWAQMLARLPEARLLVVGVEDGQREDIARAFAARSVDPARLDFAGRLSLGEFRELHGGVDIALDAHPYSGATTTLESLWMGVPTLTLSGDAPMSRSSASILATLGLHDWIARSPAEFLDAAERHATDLQRLAALRAGLRARVEGSILMDGERFTRQLEALYERMWLEKAASGLAAAQPGEDPGDHRPE